MANEYETVTLVVEYDPAGGHEKLPEKWDWDRLIGGRARVIEAWTSEFDELQKAYDDVCVKCLLPIFDEPVYATPDGTAAGPPVGDAYHVGCLGPEPHVFEAGGLVWSGHGEPTDDPRSPCRTCGERHGEAPMGADHA